MSKTRVGRVGWLSVNTGTGIEDGDLLFTTRLRIRKEVLLSFYCLGSVLKRKFNKKQRRDIVI